MRSHRRLLSLLLALCAFTTSCGGKDDSDGQGQKDAFEGVYEVTSYALVDGDCTAALTASTYKPQFFALAAVNFSPGLSTHDCTSATECSDTFNANWYFPAKVGEVWQGEATRSSGGSGTTCSFSVTDNEAAISDDGKIVMTRTRYAASSVTVATEEECGLENQIFEDRSRFTCTKAEKLEGKSVD